jgi:hypothetical protein
MREKIEKCERVQQWHGSFGMGVWAWETTVEVVQATVKLPCQNSVQLIVKLVTAVATGRGTAKKRRDSDVEEKKYRYIPRFSQKRVPTTATQRVATHH